MQILSTGLFAAPAAAVRTMLKSTMRNVVWMRGPTYRSCCALIVSTRNTTGLVATATAWECIGIHHWPRHGSNPLVWARTKRSPVSTKSSTSDRSWTAVGQKRVKTQDFRMTLLRRVRSLVVFVLVFAICSLTPPFLMHFDQLQTA